MADEISQGDKVPIGAADVSAATASAPKAAVPSYGTHQPKYAQAEMSHLKAIRVAIRDPQDKPDLSTAVAVVATALGAIARALSDRELSALDIFIIMAGAVSGTGAVLKFVRAFKPKRSTELALEHLDEMYEQVRLEKEPDRKGFWAMFWRVL